MNPNGRCSLCVRSSLQASSFTQWGLAAGQMASSLLLPTSWEGRTGWRKPVVFGISSTMGVRLLAAGASSAAPRTPRFRLSPCSVEHSRGGEHHHVASMARCALALQRVDHVGCGAVRREAVGRAPLERCVLVGHGGCVSETLADHSNTACSTPTRFAAVDAGDCRFFMVFTGHLPRESHEEEMLPCLLATAGAAASPCYEIRGQAIVILAHFLPLHATEVLLFLGWPTSCTSWRCTFLVCFASCGCWSLAFLGLWTVWDGQNIKRPSSRIATAIVFSPAPIVTAFVWVLFLSLAKHSKVVE